MSSGRPGTAPAQASPGEPSAAPAPDDEIWEALSRGDTQRALLLCVHRHGANVGRLCMAMLGSQVDADAVTQETLLSAHRAFGDPRRAGSLRAWLLGVARDKCLRRLEKTRRRRGALARESRRPGGPAPEQKLGLERRAERARALLERVKPSDRDALLLRFGADLGFDEVAAACGIDEAAARKRVSRALLRLRSALESEHDDD